MNEKVQHREADAIAVMQEAQVGSALGQPVLALGGEVVVGNNTTEGTTPEIADIQDEIVSRLEGAAPATPGHSPEEIGKLNRERERTEKSAMLLAGELNRESGLLGKIFGKKETPAGVLQEMATEEDESRSREGDFAEALEYLGVSGNPNMGVKEIANLGSNITDKGRHNGETRNKIAVGTVLTTGGVLATGAVSAVTMGVNTALFTFAGGFGAVALGGAIWGGKKLYDMHKERKVADAVARQIYLKTGKKPEWDGVGPFLTR